MIAELIWKNPLLRWRLERSTAYSVNNMMLLGLLACCMFGAWLRWEVYRAPQALVIAHPLESPWKKSFSNEQIPHVPVIITNKEVTGRRLQAGAILLLTFCMVPHALASLWKLAMGGFSRAFGPMETAPISHSQYLVAQFDWPLIKITLMIVLGILTFLAPHRPSLVGVAIDYRGTDMGAWVSTDMITIARISAMMALTMTIYRSVMFLGIFGTRKMAIPFLAAMVMTLFLLPMIADAAPKQHAMGQTLLSLIYIVVSWAVLHPRLPVWRSGE